ncbi:sialin [Planoprotostelium fungivorum]|uniref:Sialin n=1 Tax=Planoprotostelium fungivorum TaxID=1890364 RepID=A0A2P6NF68_9EUKA|nr:sialin [Planoprotostelium fungivorum]
MTYERRSGSHERSPTIQDDECEEKAFLEKPSGYVPQRFIIVFLAFIGTVVVYLQRANLSVVAKILHEEFHWSTTYHTLALSAFFGGYLMLNVFGGYLCTVWGNKTVLGLGILGSSTCTILLPLTADIPWLFLFCRFMTGFFESVAYPAMNDISSKWYPKAEASMLLGIVNCGGYLGTIVAFGTSDPINDHFGWRWVFYSSGIAGIAWCVLWTVFSTSAPQGNGWVSQYELEWIMHGKEQKSRPSVPWIKILTCLPFWACVVAHFASNWGLYTLLAWAPQYYKSIIEANGKKPAFLLYLPYIFMIIVNVAAGRAADFWINSGKKRESTVKESSMLIPREKKMLGRPKIEIIRKLFQTSGMVLPAVFLSLLCLNPSNEYVSIAFLVIAQGGSCLQAGGLYANYLDIGPEYPGILYGISNTFATIPGIAAILLSGPILGADVNKATADQWNIIWVTAAGVYVAGMVFYNITARVDGVTVSLSMVKLYQSCCRGSSSGFKLAADLHNIRRAATKSVDSMVGKQELADHKRDVSMKPPQRYDLPRHHDVSVSVTQNFLFPCGTF